MNVKVLVACRGRYRYLVKHSAMPIITGNKKANRVAANDSNFVAVAKAA